MSKVFKALRILQKYAQDKKGSINIHHLTILYYVGKSAKGLRLGDIVALCNLASSSARFELEYLRSLGLTERIDVSQSNSYSEYVITLSTRGTRMFKRLYE